MTDIVNVFRSYASVKHIDLTYESNFRYLNVWLDKDKMDSLLKNIISNALKYTPEGGSVHVYAYETEDTWNVEVGDRVSAFHWTGRKSCSRCTSAAAMPSIPK